MRKLIFGMNLTVDGFIDHTAMAADDELHIRAAEFLSNADLELYGRVEYELLAEYWPMASKDPSITPGMRRFAEAMNNLDKIVYSKSLTNAGWKTRIAREVDPQEIVALKRQPGRDILLAGGAMLAQTFLSLDLIDEYHLWIHPVVLGKGKRLFKSKIPKLVLKRLDKLGSGVVELIYEVSRS